MIRRNAKTKPLDFPEPVSGGTRPQDAALQQDEDLFFKAFRFSPECQLVSRLDDKVVLAASDVLCRLWGTTAEEVVGRPGPQFMGWLDERDRMGFLHQLKDRGECLDHDAMLRLADGREMHFTVSSRLCTVGGVPCVFTVMRDQTERRRTEAVAARLAAIVESSDDAIIGKDLNGILTSWNKAAERMFGYLETEMVGQSIMRIIPADRQDEERQILGMIRRGGNVANFETLRQRKDGSVFHVSITASPIRNPAGAVIGASKVARDITHRKNTERSLRESEEKVRQLNAGLERRVRERTAQLEAANRELEAFSYSVSHDLRAPLRAMNGFAGLLLREHGGELRGEARRYLERILNGSRQMGELIDDLLAFSRLSRQPLTLHPLDMRDVVDDALKELLPEREGRGVDIRIGPLPPCSGDPALLRQVWVNLISNALKYSRPRTPAVIEIGSGALDGVTFYFVRDNGTGFDMAYAHKLFTVFQRLHGAEEFEGTGVGLAIVHRIIIRHGGKVWAEAELDRGATFRFTLGGGGPA